MLGSSPIFGGVRVAHFLVFCVVCLRPVSCVPNVAICTGLSIIDIICFSVFYNDYLVQH